MISRQQIAEAYQCHVDTIRPRLRAAGITHKKAITLDEFRNVIMAIGYPTNEKFTYLADLAMRKANFPLSLFPGIMNFSGIKNT